MKDKPNFEEAATWLEAVEGLLADREKIERFEAEACKLRDKSIESLSKELNELLKKHKLDGNWDGYLEGDDFDIVNWCEGDFYDHIESYIKGEIETALNGKS